MEQFFKNLETAARRLEQAGETKIVCNPVRDLIGVSNLEAAYKVQDINTTKRLAGGARIVGCKIGLTSEKVQQQLGVNQPDFGVLFNDRQVEDHGGLDITEVMQPKVETEIALILSSDLSDPSLEETDLIKAIDYCVACIEIVGSRIRNWDIKITDTIADNASGSHFVLGTEKKGIDEIDLIDCKMIMKKNNEIVSEGKGSDCMGSPLQAALWLARTMLKMNRPLKKGDVILTGALGPMSGVGKGDQITATIETLGNVSVTFI